MSGAVMSYREAIRQALADSLREDPSVFVFGLDVDDHKAILGTTAGLPSARVMGTPIAEDAMTGVAIGAAVAGMKPVHVHIRADFALLAVNQLVQMASNIHYLTAGKLKVPLVVRATIGRGWGQGAQHSKAVHGLFGRIPGLKVALPTTPQDAYSLLRAAIDDPNPVLYLEHRWLYDVTDAVDPGKKATLEYAEILRPGSDYTILANSWMAVEALHAARILDGYGISCEVIDLKAFRCGNFELIERSVRKTRKALVADTDWVEGGLSAELAARIQEACFGSLDMPVLRFGFAPTPCPTARPLENAFYANARDLVAKIAAREALAVDLDKHDFYSYGKLFKGPF